MPQFRAGARATGRHGALACLAACTLATYALVTLGGGGAPSFSAAPPRYSATQPGAAAAAAAASWAEAPSPPSPSGAGFASLGGLFAGVAAAACAARGLAVLVRARRGACAESSDEDAAALSRRGVAAWSAAALAAAASGAAPAFAQQTATPTYVPDRINQDPYALIGCNPEDKKEEKIEFDMKKQYKNDTYQVVKHMKISASLDKGTPSMEKWNRRIKEEMDDWLALYRRQDAVTGRKSFYSLYSAVNTLASHFTSYGPKFPFPSKRRARFYELINQTEKYLEKGK